MSWDDPWGSAYWDEPDYDDDGFDTSPTRSRPAYVDFLLYGTFVHSTARAVLWRYRSGKEEWFPRNHIYITDDSIIVSGWLAHAKGLKPEDNDYPINNDKPPEIQGADDYGFPGYEPD